MKQSEIISLSTAELQVKLSQLKKTYAELKTAHAISPIQNPLQIRTMRRAVARLATELSKESYNNCNLLKDGKKKFKKRKNWCGY
jgi:large subunit ribosomal protein L29